MSKIKLVLKSSEVAGDFANINIVVNGNVVDQARQLSAEPETVIIDADLSDQNTLYFDILNPRAIDVNGDGRFDGPDDLTMYVTLTEMQVSEDGVNFAQLLPQAFQGITLKDSAPPHTDKILGLSQEIKQQNFWSASTQQLDFSKDRITRNKSQQYNSYSVQGNQIFENGVFNQEITNKFYWG
jgi:hypothetical protein